MLSMICYAYSMDKHSTRIYCDESCHLLHDASCVMTFGAIQCPTEKVREISLEIREIKKKYSCVGELKWTKVSDKKSRVLYRARQLLCEPGLPKFQIIDR